ncbi:hypothetical protein QQZ08_001790 [Neonectria magnoliae]|uniref:Uncharacterized protein n=1 Tax=Neonectria magnoliae TaxID=2732573 RepID=A0ABR1IF24_9HYPO
MSSPNGSQRATVSRSMSPPQPMTSDVIQRALLDTKIVENELLMSVASIRLSIGGCLAVCLLDNRESSYDIDCVFDLNLAVVEDYADEFRATIAKVALNGGFGEQWLNRQIEIFISRSRRHDLFLESVDQGIIVYSGLNLTVFASRLDWAPERKMRRVSHAHDRRGNKIVDISDAAALIRYLVRQANKLLSFEYVRGLNYSDFDIEPADGALREVAKYYAETYGAVGLADMVWDPEPERNRYNYQNLDMKWVWY